LQYKISPSHTFRDLVSAPRLTKAKALARVKVAKRAESSGVVAGRLQIFLPAIPAPVHTDVLTGTCTHIQQMNHSIHNYVCYGHHLTKVRVRELFWQSMVT